MNKKTIIRSIVPAIAGALLLSACGYSTVGKLDRTVATSQGFAKAATNEYRKLANFEAYKMENWSSARYYADKGLRSAAGEVVQPSEVSMYHLPAGADAVLSDARAKLMAALDGGARERQPVIAARAQSSLDCWMEQWEENVQPKDIAACRMVFQDSLARLGGAPVAMIVKGFGNLVFFDLNSSKLNADAQLAVKEIVKRINSAKGLPLQIIGYTDTSGRASYNKKLSKRRADTVVKALRAAGVDTSKATVEWRGEADPLVETGNGVPNPQNRRTSVTLIDGKKISQK